MGEVAVEGGGDSADGVLEEGEAGAKRGGVEGAGAHEDVLGMELVLVGWMGDARGGKNTECPFMYFVTEWTTMSAPWSRGFWM